MRAQKNQKRTIRSPWTSSRGSFEELEVESILDDPRLFLVLNPR
jgi:hypothetical protein